MPPGELSSVLRIDYIQNAPFVNWYSSDFGRRKPHHSQTILVKTCYLYSGARGVNTPFSRDSLHEEPGLTHKIDTFCANWKCILMNRLIMGPRYHKIKLCQTQFAYIYIFFFCQEAPSVHKTKIAAKISTYSVSMFPLKSLPTCHAVTKIVDYLIPFSSITAAIPLFCWPWTKTYFPPRASWTSPLTYVSEEE